jgi:hypothetical protein
MPSLLASWWPLLQPNAKPTVTWEDQQNINKFSNAFQRQGELEALIQQQKVFHNFQRFSHGPKTVYYSTTFKQGQTPGLKALPVS